MTEGTPTNEANAEVETQSLKAETKQKKKKMPELIQSPTNNLMFFIHEIFVLFPLKNNYFLLYLFSLESRLTFFYHICG